MHEVITVEIDKLQLPREFGRIPNEDWIDKLLEKYDLSSDDLSIQLADDVKRWRERGERTELIKSIIGDYLAHISSDRYSLNGDQYFQLFDKIQEGDRKIWKGLDWLQARALLSKSRIIGYLQCEERYSSSQVVKVLSATDSSLNVPFQAVSFIGATFGASITPPSMDTIDIAWKDSAKLGDELFADATIQDSCSIAAHLVHEFSPSQSLHDDLISLVGASPNDEPSWNYLQMLYWQSLILEFYDHPPTQLYEFRPRGQNATHAFKKFEVATDNPFLNNAKATAQLGKQWALNRGGDDAHALVAILAMLENNPQSASVASARLLRAWIVRTQGLWRESRSLLRVLDPVTAYDRLVQAVCAGNTETHGVIEQRVVDALSALAYPSPNWKATGLGDHVNATNTSKKKLGDVEFAAVGDLHAVAIEAHGGKLTLPYIDSHILSLHRSVTTRLESSWLSLAEAKDWSIDVVFVAHSFSDQDLPRTDTIQDVPTTFQFLDYNEFSGQALDLTSETAMAASFKKWVIDVLNSTSVRQSVRDVAAKIMGSSSELVPSG